MFETMLILSHFPRKITHTEKCLNKSIGLQRQDSNAFYEATHRGDLPNTYEAMLHSIPRAGHRSAKVEKMLREEMNKETMTFL